MESLAKLADILEVSADYLLGRTNDIGIVQVHSDLSDKEKKLLAYYYSLDEDGQTVLIDIARIVASTTSSSKTIKPQKYPKKCNR